MVALALSSCLAVRRQVRVCFLSHLDNRNRAADTTFLLSLSECVAQLSPLWISGVVSCSARALSLIKPTLSVSNFQVLPFVGLEELSVFIS